jgi:hypothetical protein
MNKSVGPPPGRFEAKKSVSRSEEMYAWTSTSSVLRGEPRFMGADQASNTLSLVATHRSGIVEPGRAEVRNISRPS